MGNKIITTLDKIDLKGQWSEEEIKRWKTLLLLMSHLSTLQLNISTELEELYTSKGIYRFSIKHKHKEIKKLIAEHSQDNFFKKFQNNHIDLYTNDAEALESVVYAWAGLQHSAKFFDFPCLNLNLAATQAFDTAKKRGKVSNNTTDQMQITAIKGEVNELFNASYNPSIHLAEYTEQMEEAADVIIATLTLLSRKNIDINRLIQQKMEYNKSRND